MRSITSSSIPRDIITTQAEEEGAISNVFHTTFYLRSVLGAIESWLYDTITEILATDYEGDDGSTIGSS